MFKQILKYVMLFFIILGFNLLCAPLNLDEVWNYGFANNMYRGLIPYLDFNMVITPFYPWLMSLPFYIFGSSMFVFHITNALILTGCLFLLQKMYQDKMWIFFLFFFFPVTASAPNYSIFLFVLLVVIVFLEKNYVSKNSRIHYIIGVLLGIAVLTKQTVGIFLLLPSLILYWKKWKILFRRLVGFFVPVFFFIIYLIISGSFEAFVNLCILGLVDFTGNSKLFNLYGLLFSFIFCITVYFIWKDKKNIVGYYVLCFYTLAIPIMDLYHLSIVFLAFLLFVLSKVKKKYFHYCAFSIVTVILMGILTCNFNQFELQNYPNDLHHFEYRYIKKDSYQFTKQVLSYVDEHRDKNIIYMVPDAYYFKIILDQDCGYFDLINQGNLGYHGSDWLINQIKNLKNTLFLINPDEYGSGNQIDQQALKYILDYGKKIDHISFYDVYILNEG